MTDDGIQLSDRPAWARRLRAERVARGWSQPDAVRALRAHASQTLPAEATLLRNWKRWEAGGTEPDDFYKPLLAKTFGTVTAALFPTAAASTTAALLPAGTGMDTLEVIARLRASDVSTSTLDALQITAERLCSEYPHMPPAQLRDEGQAWLRRITPLLDNRMTLKQHRELLALAGWVALLVGCVEYDMGDRRASEATRRAALSLGQEAEHAEIIGWAHEMQAWYALTQGDYRGVIAASQAGQHAAPRQGVAVQLAAQEAKAWARIGDRHQVDASLDRGRSLLESMPYPENLDNHFVVDPSKFDFYAMDCYRMLGDDALAETYAHQVIAAGTRLDGTQRSPMRVAEGEITLGVVAARAGDVDAAISHGERALHGQRKSLPTLLMCSRELISALGSAHAECAGARAFVDHLRTLAVVA